MPLEITIKVVPNAKQVKWIMDSNAMLKCFVRSIPEDGRANKELIDLIARVTRVPKSSITIVRGAASRIKRVLIDAPISFVEFLARIGIEYPQTLFKGE